MKYIIAQNLGGNEGCTMDYIIEVLFFRGLVGGGGGGGYSSEFLVGPVRLNSPNPNPISDQHMTFPVTHIRSSL